MNIALWILQVLLGALFIAAGASKGFQPLEALAPQIPWVNDVPAFLVRFIGISELAGGLGLILPSATRIKPILTPAAAASLGVVMVLAAGFHASRGEYPGIAVNAVILVVAGFVAYGRWKLSPIQER